MIPLTKNRRLTRWLWAPLAVIAVALFAWHSSVAQEEPVKIPAPKNDVALAAQSSEATAVLAGGCFWGMQGVFEHVKGVKQVLSGYSGGTVVNPGYEQVSSGTTGHAESIQIKYDPSQVTYGTLLRVYFSVAHNPTELNYQGPDEGTQYRSAIFYSSDEQKQVAAGLYRPAQRGQRVPIEDRDRNDGVHRLLPGGGLPPGLPDPPSGLDVHRLQRSAQDRQSEADVSRALSRQAGDGEQQLINQC